MGYLFRNNTDKVLNAGPYLFLNLSILGIHPKNQYIPSHDNQRFVIDQTLDELEKELDPSQFFRINRKFIVGIDAIGEIEPYFNNRLLLKLNPDAGEEVIVSRQRAKEFKDWVDS